MLNLTTQLIAVHSPDGAHHFFPPSGVVARVSMLETVVAVCPLTGAPIITRTAGDPVGLPEDGSTCIVSEMVLASFHPELGRYFTTQVPVMDAEIAAIVEHMALWNQQSQAR